MNVFSQNVTEVSKDTSKITLSTETARRIAVDLVEGDQAKALVKELEKKVEGYEDYCEVQDSALVFIGKQLAAKEEIIDLQNIQLQQSFEDYDYLEKEVKYQTRWKTVFEATTVVSTLALIVSMLIGGLK